MILCKVINFLQEIMQFNSLNDEICPKPFQPITAAEALGQIPIIKEPRLINDWVLWLEQRPEEKGRTTLMIREWWQLEQKAKELTPAPANLRTRVHEYGGGAWTAEAQDNLLLLSWIDDSNGCLWIQWWEGINEPKNVQKGILRELTDPICLSCKDSSSLADGLLDLPRRRWIGVMEKDGRDFLVSFSLDSVEQSPKLLHAPKDFVGYATLSPDGDYLAWVEWQQPQMPWDQSQLWLARINGIGDLTRKTLLIGGSSNHSDSISVFQPLWSSNGDLIVSEDSSGWWNVKISRQLEHGDKATSWHSPWPMFAETGMPQWVYGMRTCAWDGRQLVSAICKEGCWGLCLLLPDGGVEAIEQPFDEIAGLYANNGRAVAIAKNSTTQIGILEIDLNLKKWKHAPFKQASLEKNQISIPESFWFDGYQGKLTHAWYYPPRNSEKEASPLLVKSHSGPTSMAGRGLNLGIQFWTSRGWGVVDVNYGGSTGFGRSYRDRLDSGWGMVDVHDCAEAAKCLISAGKADPRHIAIEGGSAGGFTTLACLCFTDVFRVGACRYAVSDLSAMAKETHRFEERYLEKLVGPWPQEHRRYKTRSPLLNADKISCPVIFFQGMKDKVVLPQQTQSMANELRANQIPVEVHMFPEEGHGFRDRQVKIKVLEETEKFFIKHLGL